MNSGEVVSAELGLRLVATDQTVIPLVASLYYTSGDPYAIRVAFHVGTDEPVEWIFARDLLAAGIKARQGTGDVRVWPSAGSGGAVLHIELSSPFGQAHFEASAGAVADFLDRTYEVVPMGRERDFADIDTELDALLGQP